MVDDEKSLRSQIIRLAHSNPEFRETLLALLETPRTAAGDKYRTTDMKEPMFSIGDGVYGMQLAIGRDPVLRQDRILNSLLEAVGVADKKLMQHMNSRYLWD